MLGGARGGANRARIIQELSARPLNLNQLAEKLRVDYRTVSHHIHVLRSNSLVIPEGGAYGAMLFLSARLEAGLPIFREVCDKMRFSFD